MIVIDKVGVFALGVIFGIGIGAYAMHRKDAADSAKTNAVYVNVVDKELSTLNEKITQLASSRCMNVTTPVLNITVYDVPNLGVKKLPPPPANPPVIKAGNNG